MTLADASVRYRLPDRLTEWGKKADPEALAEIAGTDVLYPWSVPGVELTDPVIRVRLSIPVTGTRGHWLSVVWADLDRESGPGYAEAMLSHASGDTSRYAALILRGTLANAIDGYGFLGAEVTATVPDPGQLPVITGSADEALSRVLAEPQPHETAIPAYARRAAQ